MVQDVVNGPQMGYGRAQARDEFSSYDHWQRPEPQVTRAQAQGYGQTGHGNAGFAAEPEVDRLFAHENVHFEQQSSHPGYAATPGYQDPRGESYGGYETGPAYVYGGDGYEASDLHEDDAAPARPHLGPAQWGGALVSLALILGLGVWGYKLMVRDVSGVPVIRALEGSARILPEDPGGQLAMHQGLAVNSVTADGSAAPPADRYVLAPATAMLSAEDQPVKAIEPMLSSLATNAPAPEATPVAADSDVERLELIAVAEDPLELKDAMDVVAPVEGQAEVLAEKLGVMRSPIPTPRPKVVPVQLASLSADLSDAAPVLTDVSAPDSGASLDGVAGDILAAIGASSELAPADVASGTRLVQFGAFQSEELARSEWDRLTGRFSELMEGKTRVIESASSGGKSFYRLRAVGFADASEANRFCAALTAMNAACVPTVQR
ncbi:SPOR domain-containing protein [Celeribacter neptunius]|uniref:Sporulation related domain-containing protein n=1 Tax=Celeribacter neptunius TaxID=588602 RepID=A0A1I3KBA9_9RHOB|nr:SPOR domain-containing protein [Celeribacter neptunius]SFI69786.1 Sporulation related domain-containing protein [Celeribacter neptunius]